MPDHVVADGDGVILGGVTLQVHDVGAAESHADSYLTVDGRPFIGDLAFHGTHPYTADGHTRDWLAALDVLAVELDGRRLYPGHGPAGDARMLADQRRYLMMYREAVTRIGGGAPSLSPSQKEELTAVMTRYLPGAPLTWMIALGADAVAAELAAPAPAGVAGAGTAGAVPA